MITAQILISTDKDGVAFCAIKSEGPFKCTKTEKQMFEHIYAALGKAGQEWAKMASSHGSCMEGPGLGAIVKKLDQDYGPKK